MTAKAKWPCKDPGENDGGNWGGKKGYLKPGCSPMCLSKKNLGRSEKEACPLCSMYQRLQYTREYDPERKGGKTDPQ